MQFIKSTASYLEETKRLVQTIVNKHKNSKYNVIALLKMNQTMISTRTITKYMTEK